MILLADSEGPDQTARMRSLIRAFLSAYARRHVFAIRGSFKPVQYDKIFAVLLQNHSIESTKRQQSPGETVRTLRMIFDIVVRMRPLIHHPSERTTLKQRRINADAFS